SFAPIPRFHDRFARQNRCEPPPEFPLASPYPGIVHHLSGPSLCARAQSCHPAPHFHYARGFSNPVTRAQVRLLGPCFKTGRL
ncbi:hypothetical protein COEREDRAFT_22961, partial [Coemansia reversa NRRL 1564]